MKSRSNITTICIISFVVLMILSFSSSCKKDPQLFQVKNLNGDSINIFGHAGMGIGFKYPIDSYPSIEPCLRIGADGTEMDVQMTKDSVVVVYHHQDLIDGTLCNGMINDLNYQDISPCNLASPFSSKIDLLSFEDLMNALINSNYDITKYTFTFDTKLYTHQINTDKFYRTFARAIKNVAEKFQLSNSLLVESTDTSFLRILRETDSRLNLYIYPSSFIQGLEIATEMNLSGITIHNDYITSEQVTQAHDSGFKITLWGINSEEDNLKAVYKSPDQIQTDKIIHLLKIFEKYKE